MTIFAARLLEFPAKVPAVWRVAADATAHRGGHDHRSHARVAFPGRNCDWVGHRPVDPAAGYLGLSLSVYRFLIR